MHPRATSLIGRLSALRRLEIASANLAIGTASVFVAAVAVVSLAADRAAPGHPGVGIAGGNWSLRGTLAPLDQRAPGSGHRLSQPLRADFMGLS